MKRATVKKVNMVRLLVLTLLTLSLMACETVQPWERDILARPDMALDADIVDTAYREHIYFSKEASSDVASAGGGGCGCN